jgi:hypothetical protein
MFLLCLLSGGALALLLLQSRSLQTGLDAQLTTHLASAQRASLTQLQNDAHRALDDLARAAASDAALRDALADTAHLNDAHKSAQARLVAWKTDLKADQLIALDARGRVLARAGADANVWKDDLSSRPAIAQALRGYRADDAWDAGGKILRVVAAPVIAHDRQVGAVVVAKELGTDALHKIHDAFAVDAVLLLDDKPAATSATVPVATSLPAALKPRAAELTTQKRTAPFPLHADGRSFLAIAEPLPGEAAAHGVVLVVLAERPRAATIPEMISALTISDVRSKSMALAGALFVGALLTSLLLVWLGHRRPARKLTGELLQMARIEGRLYDDHHRGEFAEIARAVNRLIDRTRASVARPPEPGRPPPPIVVDPPAPARKPSPFAHTELQPARDPVEEDPPLRPLTPMSAIELTDLSAPLDPRPAGAGPDPPDPEIQSIFDQFLAIKRDCGE